MSDFTDMILEGILSEDGEYIGGEAMGFPRGGVARDRKNPVRFQCRDCARRFRSPHALADHETAKHTPQAMITAAAPDLLSIARRWAAIDGGAWNVERYASERAELMTDTRAVIARATGEAAE